MTNTTLNTSEVATKLGIKKSTLLANLQSDCLIERTKNRHYKANPALIRAGLAVAGDLKWTKQGLTFLRKAYQTKAAA